MKLHFRKIGQGRPIIILHGLFGSSDNWQTFGKNLSEKGFQVLMVDLRNHGLSPHDDQFNFAVMAEDVLELINDEHLTDVVIAGHSLGGKTAMKFAELYPDKLNGLIVIDIAPRYYSVHHRKILDTLLSVNFADIKSRGEAEAILKSGIEDSGTRQFLMKNLYWKEKEQLAWRFNLNVINDKIENVGEKIFFKVPFPKPTLFIKGEHSDYITYDDEREIFEMFNNVTMKTAPDAGHWVHADNPEWLLNEVISFLNE
ncbi:MAG TPA: alpha/beta fold hydrolase [Bacteroidia bacterium]|nr:alpha/beta fold hydrolase [Bacteroidia bacterium]